MTVRESVRRYTIPPAAQAVSIVAGVLGERTEVLGAIALVVGDPAGVPMPALASVTRAPAAAAPPSAPR
jgi:hypothetical protein